MPSPPARQTFFAFARELDHRLLDGALRSGCNVKTQFIRDRLQILHPEAMIEDRTKTAAREPSGVKEGPIETRTGSRRTDDFAEQGHETVIARRAHPLHLVFVGARFKVRAIR